MARDRTPHRKGRKVDYIHLTHPFTPQSMFSDDAIAALHDAALGVLEREGLKVLLPEAREIYAAAGALVADDMVHIGRDIVAAALHHRPAPLADAGGQPGPRTRLRPGSASLRAGCRLPQCHRP